MICQKTILFIAKLAEPVSILKSWDLKSGESSIATTLAIGLIERLRQPINRVRIDGKEVDYVTRVNEYARTAATAEITGALLLVANDLADKFGT